MNDKTKLFVFSTKEIILILLFMLFGGVASFVLGVKVGKNFSYYQAGLNDADKQKVEMLSTPEEKVSEIVKDTEVKVEKEKPSLEKTYERLEEEFNKLEKKDKDSDDMQGQFEKSLKNAESNELNVSNSPKDPYEGKYTVQLASYKKIDDAKMFAEGFQVRGYTPIVTESDIPGKGRWYRVSLGAFDSVKDAKSYIEKEKSLFEGQSVVIRRFE